MMSIEKRRIIVVFSVFVVLFTVIVGRAFYLQVINHDKLIAYSRSQIFRETTVYPYRGYINDRNGFPLAVNVQTYSVFTIPKNVKDRKATYSRLAKIVPQLTYTDILKKVKNRERYTWLARKIELSKEQAEAVKDLKGIFIEAVPKRVYPGHELLAQALGFVGIDNKGLSGIEYLFDEQLRGKPKIIKYLKDAKGRAIKFESEEVHGKSRDINLTIDREIQAVAEKALKEAVIENEASMGGVGVLDARTGEILAVANYPSFDPNHVSKSNPKYHKLSFISDPLEPGSVFKSLTIASALEHEIAKPDTSYYCEKGRLLVQNHVINEAEEDKKHEWLSVEEILRYSSNIGTTKIAFDLTYPRFKETLEKFHIGKKLGVELPGESRGIFTEEENVSPLSLSNMSFGQGVATTGLQILSAYGAIANDGVFIKPTIIKDEEREIEGTRIIEKETAEKLKKMLLAAVEDGTGANAKIPFFKIAGKTSTAQRPDTKGGYSGHIPGFVGFPLNIENPFVIFVYVDDPKKFPYYGNSVAAPVFKKIAQSILYKGKDLSKAAKVNAERDKLVFDNVKTQSSSTRFVGAGRMPNFVGLDKVSATMLAEKLGLNIKMSGIGIVSAQKPEVGSDLVGKKVISLTFSPPSHE